MKYIALDIGGSKIFAILANKKGKVFKSITIPTEAHLGKKKVIENILIAINKIRSNDNQGIGIAWAGLVNSKKGIISKAPNIPEFENFQLQNLLEKKTGLKVIIENDARLFALGEAKFGSKKNYNNLLGIIIGTGIGSGIIINGELFTGHDGFAGEIGHAIFDRENNLEVEQFFCASSLKDHLEKHGYPRIIEETLIKYSQGDLNAKKVFQEYLDKFSIWLSNLTLAFNPEVIVLGGGIGTRIFPTLIPYISEKVELILKSKEFSYTINIKSSTLENAGALGALWLITNKI